MWRLGIRRLGKRLVRHYVKMPQTFEKNLMKKSKMSMTL